MKTKKLKPKVVKRKPKNKPIEPDIARLIELANKLAELASGFDPRVWKDEHLSRLVFRHLVFGGAKHQYHIPASKKDLEWITKFNETLINVARKGAGL